MISETFKLTFCIREKMFLLQSQQVTNSTKNIILDVSLFFCCFVFPPRPHPLPRFSFSGVTCSSEIDECLSGPCQNNASCIDELNSYSCLCMPGFEGIDCAVDYNECQSNPCLNSALCLDLVDHFRCDCQPGYVGKWDVMNVR